MTDNSGEARRTPLAALVASIRRHWGVRGAPARSGAPLATLPTGVAPLDGLMGGGLPLGALTELLVAPRSGGVTLALVALAQAQGAGHRAAYIDLSGAFDPAYAAACGVRLADLRLARPASPAEATMAIESLAAGADMLVIDSLAWLPVTPEGGALLARALRRLPRTLAGAPCALLALTFLPAPLELAPAFRGFGSPLAPAATLRLHAARPTVQQDEADHRCQARVTLLTRRGNVDGGAVEVDVRVPLRSRAV